jgi:hypothetical protein
MLSIKSLVEELGVLRGIGFRWSLRFWAYMFSFQASGGLLGLYPRFIGFLRLLFGSGLGNLARGLMLSLPGCLGG